MQTVEILAGSAIQANFKLSVGQSSTTVTVEAGQVQVNTEQSSVQNTITTQQINTLPVNGRNFLDLAQLEPGVQLQSGESFDPTKAGYSALSFGGLAGRTFRRGLRRSVDLASLAATLIGVVIITEGLWRLAMWRPERLPPTRMEAAFVVIKLTVLYAMTIAVASAVLAVHRRAADEPPGLPQ